MRKGFTLLELLIVIIIVGILALITLPQFFQVVDRAKEAKAKEILHSIARVAVQYRGIYSVWPSIPDDRIIAIDLDPADGVDTQDVTLRVPANDEDPDYDYTIDASAGTATATKLTGASHRSFQIDFNTGKIKVVAEQ